jgi:hypothetical protein
MTALGLERVDWRRVAKPLQSFGTLGLAGGGWISLRGEWDRL